MGQQGKAREPSTTKENGNEPRRDDLLWKDLLARFFVPMLQSLLPDLARDIDEKRDVVFLDKELRRLARFTRHPEGGEPDENRFVDLLADVPLRSGENAWILLHAEVQGRGGNEDFPLRMHRYRGLLEGRYRKPVIALALLIEPLSKAQSGGAYSWEGYGTRVTYEFPVFRIYTNTPSFVSLTRRSEAIGLRFDVSDPHRIRRLSLRRAGCLLKAGLPERNAGALGRTGMVSRGQGTAAGVYGGRHPSDG